MLMCPPFGWEEMCSHRGRRAWALMLASLGYSTARLDLPSTGNSGGLPSDPGRLDAWTGQDVFRFSRADSTGATDPRQNLFPVASSLSFVDTDQDFVFDTVTFGDTRSGQARAVCPVE